MAPPAAKKAKTDEPEKAEQAEEAKETAEEKPAEEPKKEGPPPELEKDAPAAKGNKIKEPVAFHTPDTTMNCVFSAYGNILMPLTDGGLQFLLAGARSSVGLKAGRYFFEAKVLEIQSPAEDPTARQRAPMPKNQLSIGVATSAASLFLGDGEESICFNMEGACVHNKKKEVCSQKFGQGDVVGLLLNLDSQSPNANTVSLFKNGVRACQPKPLPDALKGKELFPAFTFRNLTFHYNFGSKPLKSLPFTCHMVKDALAKDASVTPAPEKPKDGKYEAVFPVCLPDEGTFDWLDLHLRANRHFTELSDRAILAWAEKSGLTPSKAAKTSNDKPEMGFGIPMMDDGSVRRVLLNVAPIQARSYIVMEVKANLVKEERKELLAKWGPGFKRTAAVMMGEPPAAFKKHSQEAALKTKQDASNAEFEKKKAEEKRKKEAAARQKKIERERKKAAKVAKKKQEELKKKLESERKKKERLAKGEPAEDPEEAKPEEAEEEKESEEEKEDEEMEAPEEDPPKVELSAEEKKAWFRKAPVPDLSQFALSTSFTKFSVPEDDEGFDQVTYGWQKGDKCKDYLRQWVRDRKLTTRVEDLEPSEWFSTKWKGWQQVLQTWHAKQNQYKALSAKKTAEAAAKEAKKKAEAEKKAKEAKEKAEKAEKEGGEAEEEKEEEAKEEEVEEKKEEPPVDLSKVDPFGVEDVVDVGGGQPLFQLFAYEDWTMMSLRFEIHILTHAFKRDVNDPDRAGMTLDHMPFYYQKYFKKALNTKMYGVDSLKELLVYIKDTVVVHGKNQVVQSMLPDDIESFGVFAMITEEARRYRNRRVTMGDESAALKIMNSQVGAVANAAAAGGIRPTAPVVGPRPAAGVVAARPTMGGWPQQRPLMAPFANGAGYQQPGMGMRPAWWGGKGF